ncbi:DUF3795 domain-containing protein [Eubacterium sp. 1001713B170207_170306_E7]|uniref:DUF3795 domain-containing protein n=1 Tax=Eubacterium sp. 1001713B170207_170306_E7 TaxID=2787097 RepID=UPI001898281F|nr:DUF3795 domain-containing protein [Eubacterium sp. 1001713B170207_170306_E7]
MKKNERVYPQFSLCGLNCGLCPMYHVEGAGCPGCGGKGHHSCAVKRCSQEHDHIEFCFQCSSYPCERYETLNPYDSFITYRHVLKDFQRAEQEGLESYKTMLNEKIEILSCLLTHYNDGRRKTFFCPAVNLLELEDIKLVLTQIKDEINPEGALKEKARQAVQLFQTMAENRGISIKLNKQKVEKTK